MRDSPKKVLVDAANLIDRLEEEIERLRAELGYDRQAALEAKIAYLEKKLAGKK